MAKVEWYYTVPGSNITPETIEMEFASAEEFYNERRRALIELAPKAEKPEPPAVIVPKVVANVRV